MRRGIRFFLILICILTMGISDCEPFQADTNKEVIRVGIYEMDGFHSKNGRGELQGYCIDYLKVLSGVTGWKYEYVYVSDFMEGCRQLENQEIDLLSPAMMTTERRAKYGYSELDFGLEYTVLVTLANKDDLYYEDYTKFEGMKVAVLTDYPLTEYFKEYMYNHEFASELVYFDTPEQAEEALLNGEVDAKVDSIMNVKPEHKLLARFAPQPFYFLTYKENEAFLRELNRGMNQVRNTYPTLLDELLITHYPTYGQQFFTRNEVEYVEASPVFRVAYVDNRKPLSFTDENGELAGISREIFDRIAANSGLKFEYVPLPDGEITYAFLQENKIDLLTGVEYNSENLNANGMLLSVPYITARKVMVSTGDFMYEEDETYRLAVNSGSQTIKTVLNRQYPNLRIVDFEDIEACFDALYDGKVDVLIQNQYVVEHLLTKPRYNDFVVVPMDGLSDELCFSPILGINDKYGMSEEDAAVVTSVINKAISQISETYMGNVVMRQALKHQYEIQFTDFLYSYRHAIVLGIVAIVVLVVGVFLYIRERKKREDLLREDARRSALQEKRYQTIVECSDDLIYEISMTGDASIGSERIREKFGWEIPKTGQDLDFAKAIDILHIHPEDEVLFRNARMLGASGQFEDTTLRIQKTDGEYLWCRLSRTVLMDDKGQAVSIVGKIVDVNDDMKEKKLLEQRTRTDALTGLLNKATFEKEVRDYVEMNSTEGSCFVFIDMDHFKEVNDTFGHSVGDQVIKETAKKIQLLFANFDLVGRFGGDEFCVFVKEMPRETLIDRLRFAVKKMEQEYSFEGGTVSISASIGAAYCKNAKAGYKELFDMADEAAYQAKDNGRNCYIIKDVE